MNEHTDEREEQTQDRNIPKLFLSLSMPGRSKELFYMFTLHSSKPKTTVTLREMEMCLPTPKQAINYATSETGQLCL